MTSLCAVGLGPILARAGVLVQEVLDRGGQSASRGGARLASLVLNRGAQAGARGAAQVLDRGAQADTGGAAQVLGLCALPSTVRGTRASSLCS